MSAPRTISPEIKKDLEQLYFFLGVYCGRKHGGRKKIPFRLAAVESALPAAQPLELCEECNRLLGHAAAKRLLCPFDPKPKCRDCAANCYLPNYREQMREVMKFAGKYWLLRRWMSGGQQAVGEN